MLETPEHPIEPQLRAWAQARREQAGEPFELHPVQRRQLQEEVARTYSLAGAPGPSPMPLWRLLLPRIAFGTALTGLLVFVVFQFADQSPARRDTELALHRAKNAEPAASETAPASTATRQSLDTLSAESREATLETVAGPAPLPKPRTLTVAPPAQDAGAVIVPQTSPAKPEPLELASRSEPAHAPALVEAVAPPVEAAPTSASAEEAATQRVLRDRYGLTAAPRLEQRAAAPAPTSPAPSVASKATRTSRPATGTPAPATVAVSESVALEQAMPPDSTPSTNALSPFLPAGSFAQVERYRRNLQSPRQAALSRFRVEHRGTQVRVIDEDGSVYNGVWQPAPSQTFGLSSPAAPRRGVAESQPGWGSTRAAFEVRGTHLTTGEPVVFKGDWLPGTEPRIVGHATLGTRSRFVIDAQSDTTDR